MASPCQSSADLLLAFRRESRITPSMPPLLVYLAAIIPTVYGLSAWSRLGATAVAAAVLLAATGNPARRLALILLYLLGMLWSQHALQGGRNAYHHLLPRDHCRISALAVVTGNPVPPGPRGLRHTLALRKVKAHGAWQDCTGSVLAQFGPGTVLCHGQTYIVRGFIRKTPSDGFGRHLLSQGIRHLLQVQQSRLVGAPAGIGRLLAAFYRLRNRLGSLLVSGMSFSSADLYQSMLLGRRDLFPQETKMHFIRSATLHIFAISGLHVQIIFQTLLGALKMIGIGMFSRLTASCLCCLTYILLTGATPSSVRSGIMLLLLLVPRLLRRPNNIRHAICLAALVELTVAPLCLFHCGFLFSFIIVAALIYSTPLLGYLRTLWLERWCWLPTCPQKHRILNPRAKLWQGLGSLAVAWLVSLPIAMHLNGIISLGGLAIGLPAQILALLLVAASIPKILLALTIPPLGVLLGWLMDLGMRLLVLLAEWGGSQSFCLLRPQASGYLAALFLAAFFLLICHGWKCPTVRLGTGAILCAWCLLAVLAPYRQQAAMALTQGPDGGCPALCIIPEKGKPVTVISLGSDRSARLLLRNLKARGLMIPPTLCLSDLNGGLDRSIRLSRLMAPRNLILAQRPGIPTPQGLKPMTAAGTYLRRKRQTHNREQTITFRHGTLRLRKTRHGLQTSLHTPDLNLRLTPVPDGQFLLVTQARGQATTTFLRPSRDGTVIIIPLNLANADQMLY